MIFLANQGKNIRNRDFNKKNVTTVGNNPPPLYESLSSPFIHAIFPHMMNQKTFAIFLSPSSLRTSKSEDIKASARDAR